jgi:murein L,D-transpeptidase YcbB/YkuD
MKKNSRLGDSSAAVLQIRKKLFVAGDISADNRSPLYDSVMYYGIREFQRRYGLKQDAWQVRVYSKK